MGSEGLDRREEKLEVAWNGIPEGGALGAVWTGGLQNDLIKSA